MKTTLVWKRLILEKRRITTSGRIKELAVKMGKNGIRTIRYLQEHGYIVRVLRGFYYVRTPDEREGGYLVHSIYEVVAMVLKEKGVGRWFFGLETALKLNNMTHEYYTTIYVITDSFETTKVIKIQNHDFRFLKWADRHFEFGISRKGMLRYSDKEKTVLDIAYQTYRKNSGSDHSLNTIKEYSGLLDIAVMKKYLRRYPVRFQRFSEGMI